VIGDRQEVRVFDIRHIKGLEFEAVFFVGIDEMERSLPDLFAKYLYVGATRAATYFGMTCGGELPKSMQSLREHLCENWS
jgi:DNA helicase IV